MNQPVVIRPSKSMQKKIEVISPDGKKKAVATSQWTIEIINIANNKVLKTALVSVPNVKYGGIKKIEWHGNDLIYSISNLNDVFKINPNTGDSIYSTGPHEKMLLGYTIKGQ